MVFKLFIVSKEENLEALGGNLSPSPSPSLLTFWLTEEIGRNLHSLSYTQVLIVIITLGHSM